MKIIRKPDIINQKCKICNTEVELTHKEIKKKVWKCPFCSTKNNVVFKNNIVVPKKVGSIMNDYIKSHPSRIRIVDFNKYNVIGISEPIATKLFELIKNGFNSPDKIKKATGLKISSAIRYAYSLKDAKLITINNGEYFPLSHVATERISYKPSF